ncbi:MAG: ABC transporter ATP-binding protein [Lachnospiraceae bacterium]|nr:ABC transporter ATP-binding protein [Lachnospiraceae bacterium]
MKNKEKTFLSCVKTAMEIMPGHFCGMLFVHIAYAVLPVFGIQMSRRIYSFAQASGKIPQPFSMLLLPVLLYMVYLVLMKGYVVYYQRVAIQFGGLLEFEKKVKIKLHGKCNEVDLLWYEKPQFYNNLWEAKVASINIYRIVECGIALLGTGLNILLMSGYAAMIHPGFFALIVLTAFPAMAKQVTEGMLRSRQRSRLAKLAKSEKAYYECLTGIAYAKERSVYRSAGFLMDKWKHAAENYQEEEYKIGKFVLCVNMGLTLLKAFAVSGIYLFAGLLFFDGQIDYAGFMTAISATLFLQSQYMELFSDIGYFSGFRLMVKPYFEFMDIESPARPQPLTEKMTLGHVSFSYPAGQKEVLHDINLSISKGEKIAVVGVNGAGKTTLAKLLAGLLPPTEGGISGRLSDDTCVMFQDYQKYALTLAENIAIQELSPHSPEKIEELIEELELRVVPENEVLGREFGTFDLSGGQWQRAALARLYYQDGQVLILDEPTSAIDPLHEKALNDFILRKKRVDQTLVIISHRLSVAKQADRVFVLNDGGIAEQGTHEELIRDEGSLYSRLWAAQVGWYQN